MILISFISWTPLLDNPLIFDISISSSDFSSFIIFDKLLFALFKIVKFDLEIFEKEVFSLALTRSLFIVLALISAFFFDLFISISISFKSSFNWLFLFDNPVLFNKLNNVFECNFWEQKIILECMNIICNNDEFCNIKSEDDNDVLGCY